MESIRSVFAKGTQLDRRIEKVIQYDMSDAAQLRQEVSEYVITDNIRHNFERLLDLIDQGMEGGSTEIGVWVSGFYGSGKSSFTKYLGFGLDQDRIVDDMPFLKHLQDRMESVQLQQRFSTVAQKHNPTVIMLDLASEQLADENMADISSVLYAKVMQWAGYARDRKIAYLEFMLEEDDHLGAFAKRVEEQYGMSWDDVKNQPLVANRVASDLAHEFYPDIFRDRDALASLDVDERVSERERTQRMIDLIRRRADKENIIFVLDEVGEYVSSIDARILNFQGFAQNLKALGGGKVWVVATAQQTLTEDDPRARFNTAKLFKLKDRFPVRIDLEASDIREICYKRLLGKSADGEEMLKGLFASHGQKLRKYTQLEGAGAYEGQSVNEKSFYRLYPFLPQHFTLLLELLGRLSKSTGGTGLRSAIKVVQDVMVNPDSLRKGTDVLARQPLGTLATAVTFYDTLRRDIRPSYEHIVKGVKDVENAFGDESTEVRVAKTVAILQIVENCPSTRKNVAAFLHPSVDAGSQTDVIDTAVEALLGEESIRISEVDKELRFLSEAVNDLEDQRRGLVPSVAEHLRIRNTAIKEIFTPTPKASVFGAKTVRAGLTLNTRTGRTSIDGSNREVQFVVDFAEEAQYDATRSEYIQESTQRSNTSTVYLLGYDPSVDAKVDEIYRCKRIVDQNRRQKTDKEVSDYLNGQRQRAETLRRDLDRKLKEGLTKGTFIFRGKPVAVGSISNNLREATQKQLREVAQEVYEKFEEAAVNPRKTLAKHFLEADLKSISRKDDPLELVEANGRINTSHGALRSILDYLQSHGQVDGGKLQKDFSSAPFGWSKDAIRYLVAALLTSSEVKLRVGGADVTVRSNTAVEHLRGNRSFKKIGVALRQQEITNEQLDNACTRLTELTGEDVMPLEEEVNDTVQTFFPQFRQRYASLPTQLRALDLPGVERAEDVLEAINELIQGSAADAAARLGAEDAPLVNDLKWAHEVEQALHTNAVGNDIETAQRYVKKIDALPQSGVFQSLQNETEETRRQVREIVGRETFYDHISDLRTHLTALKTRVDDATESLRDEHQQHIQAERDRLQEMPEWKRMDADTQRRLSDELDDLFVDIPPGIDGLQQFTTSRYEIEDRLDHIESEIRERGAQTVTFPDEEDRDPGTVGDGGGKRTVSFGNFPKEFTSPEDIDQVIDAFEDLKNEFGQYERIVLDW